jgi:hypothetical protein
MYAWCIFDASLRTFLFLNGGEWAAIMATAYTVITYYLWRNSAQTLRETRDQFIMLNNPVVSVSQPMYIGKSAINDNDFGIAIIFKNFGYTTAHLTGFLGRFDEKLESIILTPNHLLDIGNILAPQVSGMQFMNLEIKGENGEILVTSAKVAEDLINGVRASFLKFAIYYEGIDKIEYVFYCEGGYDNRTNEYRSMKSWHGKVDENIDGLPKKVKEVNFPS